MALKFVPAPATIHTEASGRQLEFIQNNDGDVVVNVKYGLKPINTIYQDCVNLDRGPIGPITSLSRMTKEERKIVIDTVARENNIFIQTINGPMSQVASRQFDGNYHTVIDITIRY